MQKCDVHAIISGRNEYLLLVKIMNIPMPGTEFKCK